MLKLEINLSSKSTPNWQTAWLGSQTINVQHVNPVFDTSAGGAFSEEFELDCEMNHHILGNTSDIHGGNVFRRLYGHQFRLSFGGTPVMFGVVRLDKELDFEGGTVKIELASANQEWSELLEGKNLHDLDFLEEEEHRVPIGLCFADTPVNAKCGYDDIILRNYRGIEKRDYGWGGMDSVSAAIGDELDIRNGFEPVSGFYLPKALFVQYRNTDNNVIKDYDFLNVDLPYDPVSHENKFCHIRTCFQQYKGSGDSWTATRRYNVHEPEEMNSAPCFFVAYVMDRIFEAMKVSCNGDVLSRIPDFYRVAIMHSNCGYSYRDNDDNVIEKIGRIPGTPNPAGAKTDYGYMKFQNSELEVYFSGSISATNALKKRYYTLEPKGYHQGWADIEKVENRVEFVIDNGSTRDLCWRNYSDISLDENTFDLYKAFATADNLPDVSFSDFLDGIRDGFGLRYVYDSGLGQIRIVSVKEILSQGDVVTLPSETSEAVLVSEDIKGFVLKYSGSPEYKENAITGMLHYTQGSDDTVYNYYDYRRVVLFGSNYAIPNYKLMLRTKSEQNMNLYIDTLTGNKFRFKVDEEAKTTKEWYPSLFEVGGYRDVRIGDCSDEERMETVSIGFSPVVVNDVNGLAEYLETSRNVVDDDGNIKEDMEVAWPKHALMVEGETHVDFDSDGNPTGKFVPQTYTFDDIGLDLYYNQKWEQQYHGQANLSLVCLSKLNYDAAAGEPFFDGDCSFSLGVMRGSGNKASRIEYDVNYDGEGNSRWTTLAGSNAEFSADSTDACGNLYDYNGDGDGLGYGEKEQIVYSERPVDNHSAAAYLAINFPQCNSILLGLHGCLYSVEEVTRGSTKSFVILANQTNDGTVVTDKELQKYVNMLSDNSLTIALADARHKKLVVGIYARRSVAEVMKILLDDLRAVYFGGSADPVNVKFPSVKVLYEMPLSLKLKAEAPYKGGVKRTDEYGKEYLETDSLSPVRTYTDIQGNIISNEDVYYPIDSQYAKRGIFDRLYAEYAYFVMHRKIVRLAVDMELATLLSIDMTKKYRIGNIVGWIKQYSYSLDPERGLTDIKFEMYFL